MSSIWQEASRKARQRLIDAEKPADDDITDAVPGLGDALDRRAATDAARIRAAQPKTWAEANAAVRRRLGGDE